MVKLCHGCGAQRAALRRPKTGDQLCKECFYAALEEEVHRTIVDNRLFKPGEKVAVAASGGKDSTVLAHMMTTLNERHGYGLDLLLLSIDEGISGYRDDSLDTVKRNEAQYQIPLHVFSYKDLYGWTMDEIVREIGTRSNCTFCGVFRRQALDRGATLVGAAKLATGHNADDIAETVLLNIVRGDLPRLGRCANIITGEQSALPRVKPFKYTYEKEIVMYAYFKKLDYFSTECVYAPFAARGFARDFVKDLEAARPRAIVDLIRSAEQLRLPASQTGASGAATAADGTVVKLPQPGTCERCGYISSQPICKACVLLDGLNRGLPRLGVSRSRPGRAARADKAAVRPRAGAAGGDGGAALACAAGWQHPAPAAEAGADATPATPGSSTAVAQQEMPISSCSGSACAAAAAAAGGGQRPAAGTGPMTAMSGGGGSCGEPGLVASSERRHSYLQNVGPIASHPSARSLPGGTPG